MEVQLTTGGSTVLPGEFAPNARQEERKAIIPAQFLSPLPGMRKPAKRMDVSAVSPVLEQVSLVFNKRLQFVVDHESHDVIVKVIDRETDKVIKVLPPEELQRLHDSIRETIGFLFDERV